MSRSRAFLLSAVLLVSPVLLAAKQKAARDFNTFFATFKTAVEHKDKGTLASLMSPSFDLIRGTNVPPGAVFSALDSNHGQQWLNLQQAVQGPPEPYAGNGPYKNSRVLRCTPLAATDNCLVIFQKDSQHRWRWRAMVMPTVGGVSSGVRYGADTYAPELALLWKRTTQGLSWRSNHDREN